MKLKSLLAAFMVIFAMSCISVAAFAQTAVATATPIVAPSVLPTDINGAFSDVATSFSAVKSGNYTMAVAVLLMLIVFAVRTYLLQDFSTKILPWVSAGLGVLAAFAMNLAAGESWFTAFWAGITMGTAASGLWSLVSGLFTPKSTSSSS